jgi:PAS domain S-box-containing protein
MDEETFSILLVEDDESHAELIRRSFEAAGDRFRLNVAHCLEDARRALTVHGVDLVIADLVLPDGGGTDLLPDEGGDLTYALVVMTGQGDEKVAVTAMKAGALDYVVKSDAAFLQMPRIADRVLREWRHMVERTRAQQALRESEQRYRTLVETMKEGLAVLDEKGVITYANEKFAHLLGFPQDELIGRHHIELVDESDKESYLQEFERRTSAQSSSFETALTARNGTEVPVILAASPLFDDAGNFSGTFGVFTDITGQKRVERELKESRERLELALEAAELAVWDWNLVTDELVCNQRWAEMIGHAPDEIQLASRNWDSLIHPVDVESVVTAVNDHLEGRTPYYETEHRRLRNDGSWVWVQSRGKVVARDRDGKPLRATAVLMDITRRKHAEEAFRKSHALLEAVSRAQRAFIVKKDRAAVFDGLLDDLLSLTESRYGVIEEIPDVDEGAIRGEIIAVRSRRENGAADGWHGNLSVDGRQFPLIDPAVRNALATGGAIISNNLPVDGGSAEPGEDYPPIQTFMGLPCYLGEKLIGLVGIANRLEGYDQEMVDFLEPYLLTLANIIEAYRTDNKRKDAERRVQSSLAEKEILLREVHHRVKNNLSVMNSLLRIQEDYVEDSAHRKILADARNRVRSMAVAHEKLHQSESLAELDVEEYVGSLVDHLVLSATDVRKRVTLSKKMENISFGLDTAIPVGFIVTELVTNCLKHAFPDEREGEIEISLERVADEEFALTVSDNGVGAPEEIDFGSPGSLGLELVDTFVQKLRGKLEVEREGGTRVRLRFREIKPPSNI